MNALERRPAGVGEQPPERSEGVLEITLLLSARQLARLEEAARQRRMTMAALVRRLLHDFLNSALGRP